MLKKTLIATVLASFMLAPVAQATDFFKFQSVYGPAQGQNIDILIPWADSFKEKTQGKVEVEFFSVNGLAEASSTPQAIKDGLLEIGIWAGSSQPKDSPYVFSVISLPFSTKGSQHGTELLWTAYNTIPEVKANVENPGVLLAQWTSAAFALSSINNPIHSPADVKGKRVMVITASDSTVIEAWGGVPVYVSASDVYVGLQRGMAEIFYAPVPYQKGLKLGEIIKYLSVIPCSATSMIMSMNKDLYDELEPEVRDLFVQSTGKDFSMKIAQHLDADVQTCLDYFRESKVDITELSADEIATFNTALDGLRTSYWIEYLQGLGIADAKAWMNKVETLSASIPNPQ